VINTRCREWGEGAFGISSLRGLLPCFGEGLIKDLVAIGVGVVATIGDGHYKVMSRNPGLVARVGRIFGSWTLLNNSDKGRLERRVGSKSMTGVDAKGLARRVWGISDSCAARLGDGFKVDNRAHINIEHEPERRRCIM